MAQFRKVLSIQAGQPTSDGAGVRLTRVFGGQGVEQFDPFLMLDEFGSDKPDDYIAGFPPHPHRGFETVTYMLEGRMRHEDHMGNVGLLQSGGVQWMTAARGIIHSEMPEQEEGVMRGFQLWLNLPGKNKLMDASYRDIQPQDIPRLTTEAGVEVVVIAGRFDDGQVQQDGAVQRPDTEPQYFDFHLPAGRSISPLIPAGHRALLYVYEGAIEVEGCPQTVGASRLVRLADEGELQINSAKGARVLLIAGKPLREPVVQYGPFVMNTREEIEQALRDFRDDRLTA
ncbi:pirin family protein [Pseudomonas cichorii]|uniref:Pirin family protein n=1 Tax=Pseudomonas lijiangensis TaxID=2995658 RepID=A0ABX8HMK5_9PSED|nr:MULTISPECIES: pirin family protein [Pseudomonas syringae group]MBX8500130.1 pirin family protein [Pseudomonas lijiangensis]MBX8503888.1 pirin family protein [Pseudomonas lijiangensis]MBX8508117.1 pirin family protein [Pseudomonas cichorii]MBX8526268.1 pirin family protein [Pseudomonas cichorii]QWU81722.1 pirin family protein [Pseudomonas lijiangensis]